MKRNLTILVLTDIIPEDEKGGSGTVARELSKNLQNHGHKTVISTKGETGNGKYEIINGIEVFRYHSKPLKFFNLLGSIPRNLLRSLLS